MIIALVYLAVLASVPLAGGRITALADLPLRRSGLAVAAILIQIVVISLLPGGDHAIHTTLHIASYVLLGLFAWSNRHIPGLALASFGGLLNFIAITANGGVMPADRAAIASLGHKTAEGDFANSQILEHPKLQFLGDVFATPASWPIHNVFSIGDIVLVIGVAVLVHVACGSRLVPRRRRLAAETAAA
jgi:ABC-type antimicrobial peptide transport system permease subunit